MAKGRTTTVFFCQSCGYESPKWLGQCPGCREWNTFVEETVEKKSAGRAREERKAAAAPVCLSSVPMDEEERVSSGLEELNRVLGGGIVPGSLVLVGGDPGIGKSTLLLQVCQKLSGDGREVLYISGEESLKQIKMRAARIGSFSDKLRLFCETNLDIISETIREVRPQTVIIDSIQTMYSESSSSAPGSVSQVREATSVLLGLAKGLGVSVFIVGHVTKEGTVAGPRVLEHMVDTVLYFEGDRHASYRILRAVKNRFGSTNEIQALVTRSPLAMPRRTAAGMDYNRVNLLLAVLEKRLRLQLSNSDVYINIAGGFRVGEPAIDLAVVLAVVSSARDRAVDEKTLAFGEVGLSGEVRAVSQAAQRVQEAKKLGFTTVILPEVCREQAGEIKGVRLCGVRTVAEAVEVIS